MTKNVKVPADYEVHLDKTQHCFPYAVSRDEKKGRILVATREIHPGELIFAERPLVVGPAGKFKDVCLVCLKRANTTCPRCLYPMCSYECSEIHCDQMKNECDIIISITKDHKESNPSEAILALRCLLLKEKSPEDFHYLLSFESHLEELRKCPDLTKNIQLTVRQIQEVWGQQQFSQEEIAQVEGILYINAVEQPAEDGGGKAFFPLTSLGSHNCINNTFRRRIAGGILETRAKVTIKEDEEITLHYACGFKGRSQRRRLLYEGWFFHCQCQRCLSPDELGAHLSTMTCCSCSSGGLVLPVIARDDDHATLLDYECKTCGKIFQASEILEMESQLTAAIESANANDIEALSDLLSRYGDAFHPRHFLILVLKWLMINLLGRRPGLTNADLSDQGLEKKENFCKDYLQALDIVDPGISHNRGRTLWEFYSVRVFVLQRDFQTGKIFKGDFLKGLGGLATILEEVVQCLSFSEESSFEAKVFELAGKALVSVKETIQIVHLL